MCSERAKTDLRDGVFFRKWAQQLPVAERDLLNHAAVEYLEVDDTIRMIFTNDMKVLLESREVCDRLVDHIRAFYDVCRQQWISSGKFVPGVVAPRRVVMPRVTVQVAPAKQEAH